MHAVIEVSQSKEFLRLQRVVLLPRSREMSGCAGPELLELRVAL